MSVQAMGWALDVPLELMDSPTARHVLVVLANYAGENGQGAFPSIATIARQTGLSRRSVQSNLTLLANAGMIRPGNPLIAAAWIGRGDQRPNVWDLALERGASAAPREPNGVQLTVERGAGAAPDPSLTVISLDNARTRDDGTQRPIPDGLTPELWIRWGAYRRKRDRRGWTLDAAKLSFRTLSKLADDGHSPIGVIEQSIEHGWSGLFPVKHSEGAQRATGNRSNPRSAADRVADANRRHDQREEGDDTPTA